MAAECQSGDDASVPHAASGGDRFPQSGEVAGRHGEGEADGDAFEAALDGLGHAAHGLGPAEALLDPIAVFPGEGMAGVAGAAAIDGGVSGLQGRRSSAPPFDFRSSRDSPSRWPPETASSP